MICIDYRRNDIR